MSTILLLDDEIGVLNALRRLLRQAPCTHAGRVFELEVEAFISPSEALKRLACKPFDLILSDFRMPEMDGVSFLVAARDAQPDAARLILSGYADLNGLQRAINDAAIERFISKPWNDYELLAAIGQALSHRELLLENRRLADLMRLDIGEISAAEFEARTLESVEPGITRVRWGADGSVLLDDE
jgi:two-component system probable response regulator PhcQ